MAKKDAPAAAATEKSPLIEAEVKTRDDGLVEARVVDLNQPSRTVTYTCSQEEAATFVGNDVGPRMQKLLAENQAAKDE